MMQHYVIARCLSVSMNKEVCRDARCRGCIAFMPAVNTQSFSSALWLWVRQWNHHVFGRARVCACWNLKFITYFLQAEFRCMADDSFYFMKPLWKVADEMLTNLKCFVHERIRNMKSFHSFEMPKITSVMWIMFLSINSSISSVDLIFSYSISSVILTWYQSIALLLQPSRFWWMQVYTLHWFNILLYLLIYNVLFIHLSSVPCVNFFLPLSSLLIILVKILNVYLLLMKS